MKRAKVTLAQVAEPDNLMFAFWKAQRHKRGKPEVELFRSRLDANLKEMSAQIMSGVYPVGRYHYFTINDPKKRLICAAAFPERVLHHAIMNVCDPVFESFQIHQSYACRRGKGTLAAVLCSQQFSSRYAWFLKLDIRKYFDSIQHAVLNEMLARRFRNKDILDLFGRIILSYRTLPGRGIPIGNLTSQYFANLYLGYFDHWIKDEMRVSGYVRYMDDFVLWSNSKRELLDLSHGAASFLDRHLGLGLKTCCLNRSVRGLPFLGYVVSPSGLRLSQRSRRRYRSKMRFILAKFDHGDWNDDEAARHVEPLVAFTEHAGSSGFRRAVLVELSSRLS